MRLKISEIDLRSQTSGERAVIDEDTGKTVGQFAYGHQGGRTVSLFDGKYTGSFERHEECVAFAMGVEAVLNHMISTGR